ncbi:hypothetical protein [Stappia indica]|uniref:hypothetical protein n=1 Tax=Stappia indica TaxID=538381 RepID=UPI001D17DB9F|nr:hypothetical protein [Stappia indica]MCC4243186.1 hypothetical protein [Stappia indica]
MSTVTHEPFRDAAAIDISLGDDVAAANDVRGDVREDVRLDDYFGRRIEEDRTWTIYHVYTGVPAFSDGMGMTGLSRTDATRGMRLLNSPTQNTGRIERSSRRRSTTVSRLSCGQPGAGPPVCHGTESSGDLLKRRNPSAKPR